MFGLFGLLKKGHGNTSSRRRHVHIESLEPRMLLNSDVLINSTAYDSVTSTEGYAGQQAATNVAFDPSGSDTPTIVSAYQNEVMAQFAPGSSPYRLHVDGTSISTNGGSSFDTLLPDTPLPDGPGSSYYGDGGNATLARDPTTGNIFLATTSDTGGQHHPDIQVFESTTGGQSFSAPTDATPGFSTSAALDKPWIVAGSNGKLWLTFVNQIQDGTNKPGIYLTDYTGSWPSLNYGDNLLVDSSNGDLVHGPQVVLDSSGNPYVIYYRQSPATGAVEIDARWPGASQPQTLVSLNPNNTDKQSYPDMFVTTGDGTPIRAEYFPSAAYDSATNQIYVAYADRDTPGVPHVNIFSWTPGSTSVGMPQEVPIPGDSSNVGEAWNPSIAISPDGGSLFVGFYGLPNSSNDDVYVYGATDSISASGSLTMNATQQLSTSSFRPANTPGDGLVKDLSGNPLYYYWGDNDSASANYDSFYYSHLETSAKTFNVGGTPTNYVESDVYLTTVPIDYSSRLAQPSLPGYSESSGTVTLTWDNSPYQGLLHGSPNMYIEYSTHTKPWTPVVFNWPYTDPQATAGTVSFDSSSSNFTYNSSSIYYFRLRVQYPGGILGSSSYSSVRSVAASNTMVFNGTTGNDTIVLREDNNGQQIDYTLNGVAQTPVSIISGGSLMVLGDGGTDSITFDFSNGNFLAGTNVINDGGGTATFTIIGSTGTDTVSLGSPTTPVVYDGDTITANDTTFSDLAFNDDGGTDTINCESIIPMDIYMSGSDTINNYGGTVTLHFV